MVSKPKVIFEKRVPGAIHLLVRVDDLEESDFLSRFFGSMLKNKDNVVKLIADLHDIFVFDKTVFFSNRIIDDEYTIDYLIIDEGKLSKVAFLNFVIHSSDSALKCVSALIDHPIFEL